MKAFQYLDGALIRLRLLLIMLNGSDNFYKGAGTFTEFYESLMIIFLTI